MATKAQKRAAGMAKRKQFLEDEKNSGLESLRRAQQEREERDAVIKEKLSGMSAELEETLQSQIIAQAERHGELVRQAEVGGEQSLIFRTRRDWTDFLSQLAGSPHRQAALNAYTDVSAGTKVQLERDARREAYNHAQAYAEQLYASDQAGDKKRSELIRRQWFVYLGTLKRGKDFGFAKRCFEATYAENE